MTLLDQWYPGDVIPAAGALTEKEYEALFLAVRRGNPGLSEEEETLLVARAWEWAGTVVIRNAMLRAILTEGDGITFQGDERDPRFVQP